MLHFSPVSLTRPMAMPALHDHRLLQIGDAYRTQVDLRRETLRISVVVPTCGRPQLLHRCLACLVAQHVPPHQVEIIVVDDAIDAASAAGTCAVVGRWMLRAIGS